MAEVKNIKNVETVIKYLLSGKYNNTALHIGILCVIAKESNFIPQEEKGYQNTSNERILKIFGKRLPQIYHTDDDALTLLKKDKEKFFNLVYGGRGGNNKSGDGYKYRGRGLNQLTFINNYRKYSTDKYDLVKNPELVNNIDVAAQIVVKFFEDNLSINKDKLMERMQITDDLINIEKGILLAANINAGVGNTLNNNVVIRAFEQASKYKEQMIEIYNNYEEK